MKDDKLFWTFTICVAVVEVALSCAVIYAAVHFALKYW